MVVAVAALVWFFAVRGNGESEQSYQTVTAKIGDVKQVVSGTGTVEAQKTHSVVVQTSGVVDRLTLEVGDTVKLGRELLRVNGQPTYAIYGKSPIYRQLAYGDTGNDVKWLEKSLDKMGYDTAVDSEYDSDAVTSVNDFQDARGLTVTSQVGPETFQTFPLPLVVMDLAVSQGQTVGPGKVAMTLANPKALKIQVDINEIDIPKVKVGQKVDITVDALPGKVFPGRVSKISPGLVSIGQSAASSTSGVVTYPVTIDLLRVDPKLKAGMKASADIVIARRNSVLTLPAGAVRDRDGRKSVLVTVRRGRIRSLPIEVGLTSDATVQVVSGLQEGQEVVIGVSSASSATGSQSGSTGQSTSSRQRGGFGPFGGPGR